MEESRIEAGRLLQETNPDPRWPWAVAVAAAGGGRSKRVKEVEC